MRKLVCIFLALCLLSSFCSAAGTSPQILADAEALLLYWEENGYPDDVGSIYSTDGSANHLTVQLVGDTDGSRAAELRAMLQDPSTLTIEEGRFTEKDLRTISENIKEELMPADDGIVSCGVGWGKSGGFGLSGNELRVVVTVAADRVEDYAKQLGERYGEAVVVEADSGTTTTDEAATDAAPTDGVEESAAAEPAQETGIGSDETLAVTICLAILAATAVAVVLLLLLKKRKK